MFSIVTAPASEPISLSEAREHLRVETTDEDAYILGLIQSAREIAEQKTGRRLITQTWQLVRDNFAGRIQLLADTSAITSVSYQDTDNATQTLASSVYELRTTALVPEVGLKYSQSWPSILCHPGSVTIEFTVGYGDDTAVPQPIKQAMLLLIGDMYEHREETSQMKLETMPMASKYLLSQYRVPVIA